MDTEHSPGRVWEGGRLCGLSLCLPDRTRYYLPVAHEGGGNLDADLVRRWARAELRGKHLYFWYAGHDNHVLENFGISLERQGNHLHDVLFQLALLDDNRREGFHLGDVAQEFLHQGKEKLPLKPQDIYRLPSSLVGPYAERDAEMVWDLKQYFRPQLEQEGLLQVLDLEDRLIYAVCEMERNGARLDVPKIHRWRQELTRRRSLMLMWVSQHVGWAVNPSSNPHMVRLFKQLALPEDGTFTEEVLKATKHPLVKVLLAARQLANLDSKCLKKYLEAQGSDGLVRYNLHQLRSQDVWGRAYGTDIGRFSSSNINMQQVNKHDKQEPATWGFPVREVFLPDEGCYFGHADASQIEYRMFVHYSRSQRLIDMYVKNPDQDFHKMVMSWTNLGRSIAKNVNFRKLYGGGSEKFHAMCPHIPLKECIRIDELYDETFPEAKRLINRATRLAERQGYVRTKLGRRRRFPDRDRMYRALHAVLCGSASDVMKQKLVELYENRKTLGIHKLRWTVHDESNFDLARPDDMVKIKDLLNEQTGKYRVPILWETEVGRNWHDVSCDKETCKEKRHE